MTWLMNTSEGYNLIHCYSLKILIFLYRHHINFIVFVQGSLSKTSTTENMLRKLYYGDILDIYLDEMKHETQSGHCKLFGSFPKAKERKVLSFSTFFFNFLLVLLIFFITYSQVWNHSYSDQPITYQNNNSTTIKKSLYLAKSIKTSFVNHVCFRLYRWFDS